MTDTLAGPVTLTECTETLLVVERWQQRWQRWQVERGSGRINADASDQHPQNHTTHTTHTTRFTKTGRNSAWKNAVRAIDSAGSKRHPQLHNSKQQRQTWQWLSEEGIE